MADLPMGENLLATARRCLLDELLPSLGPDQVYPALMVANAMAIAGRELQALRQAQPLAWPAIQQFYQEAGLEAAGGPSSLDGDLAEKIRAGTIGPHEAGRLHALLLGLARERLALSNPKYLQASQEAP